MTKAAIIAARKKFSDAKVDTVSIMTDENISFSSRDAFLLWDDANELLLVICPRQNTVGSDKNHRGELCITEYDKIVCMSAIPDLSKLDSWLPEFVKGTNADINQIKNSFNQIMEDKYFV